MQGSTREGGEGRGGRNGEEDARPVLLGGVLVGEGVYEVAVVLLLVGVCGATVEGVSGKR